jgi:hypothetical protein
VIVGAPHVERVCASEPKNDPVLVVDAHGVETSKVATERVRPIPGRKMSEVLSRNSVAMIAAKCRFAKARPEPDFKYRSN